MKYGEWLTEWLNNYVRVSAKSRTFERYEQIVNQHIIPKMGETDMDALTPIGLQQYVTDLLSSGNKKTGKGLASNSVNSIINVIQNSLRVAHNLGLTSAFPAEKIMRPKSYEKQVECFSLTEQKKIEKAVLGSDKTYLVGIVLCLYTGLRIGELLSLEWQDIDFCKGIISVTKSCHDGKNGSGGFGRIIDTPKTPSSQRVIPIPKQLLPLLKKMKRNSNTPNLIEKNGKVISVRTYQRIFDACLLKINIPHHGFHSLRHTFATRALECGVDVKTLSEILGHKSPTVTLNRYAHSMFNHKVDMMNLVGKTFSITM